MSKTLNALGRFMIGDFVKIERVAHKHRMGAWPCNRIEIVKKSIDPVCGWISGAKVLYEGVIKDCGDSNIWIPERRILLLIITTAWLRKPLLVFPEDTELISKGSGDIAKLY